MGWTRCIIGTRRVRLRLWFALTDPFAPHGLHAFRVAELFDHGEAVGEFGARVEVVEPELVEGEEAGDVGVLLENGGTF